MCWNLPCHWICRICKCRICKPAKPNLPNPTYQTYQTKPNLANQAQQIKANKPKLLIKAVNSYVHSDFGNVCLSSLVFNQSFVSELLIRGIVERWVRSSSGDADFLDISKASQANYRFSSCMTCWVWQYIKGFSIKITDFIDVWHVDHIWRVFQLKLQIF